MTSFWMIGCRLASTSLCPLLTHDHKQHTRGPQVVNQKFTCGNLKTQEGARGAAQGATRRCFLGRERSLLAVRREAFFFGNKRCPVPLSWIGGRCATLDPQAIHRTSKGSRYIPLLKQGGLRLKDAKTKPPPCPRSAAVFVSTGSCGSRYRRPVLRSSAAALASFWHANVPRA
jgi:hypothetical protein